MRVARLSPEALAARRLAAQRRVADMDFSVYTDLEVKIAAGVENLRRLRREHQQVWDPGHLYIIRFRSGVVKVGRTVITAGLFSVAITVHKRHGP